MSKFNGALIIPLLKFFFARVIDRDLHSSILKYNSIP